LKIRIKFRKYGIMKFIGHLDIMRYFQKAIRRAEIDIAYSEGYSPHQIMSFAAPLGVGLESDGEYFDIEVHSTKSSTESIENLNREMVDGMEIIEFKCLPENAKTAMSIVAAADYKVILKDMNSYPLNLAQWEEKLSEFFVKPSEVLITKKTKKSEKIIDLKKLVYDFRIEKENPDIIFYLKVCTGSMDNIKPELVLEAFFDYLELPYVESDFHVRRLEAYMNKEEIEQTDVQSILNNLVPLGSAGEDIES